MKRAVFYVPLSVLFIGAALYVVWEGVALSRLNTSQSRTLTDPFAGRDGRKEAEADLARGHPRYKEYGFGAGMKRDWPNVLQVRFAVEVEPIADCVVSAALLKYVESYNATIEAHIAKKYGPGLFEAARQESLRTARPNEKSD